MTRDVEQALRGIRGALASGYWRTAVEWRVVARNCKVPPVIRSFALRRMRLAALAWRKASKNFHPGRTSRPNGQGTVTTS